MIELQSPTSNLGSRSAPQEIERRSRQIEPLCEDNTLDEQCLTCFEAIRCCILEALRIADLSQTAFLTKSMMRRLATDFDEQRLRLDIWILDCKVGDGHLPTAGQEPDLQELLRSMFRQFHTHTQAIYSHLDAIRRDGLHVQSDHDEIRASVEAIVVILHELAKMQSAIQMFQAIQLNLGPHANLRRQVQEIANSIDQHQELSVDETLPPGAPASHPPSDSDIEQCSNCHKSFPWHVFSFHSESCPKEGTNSLQSSHLPSIVPCSVEEQPTMTRSQSSLHKLSDNDLRPKLSTPEDHVSQRDKRSPRERRRDQVVKANDRIQKKRHANNPIRMIIRICFQHPMIARKSQQQNLRHGQGSFS
jgi:hypothetical protein